MAARLRQLRHWARPRRFDAAVSHGSYDLTLTARRLRIVDDDLRLRVRPRAAPVRGARARASSSRAIPADRLRRYGLRPPKLARYPGLKEEYYLADFQPDAEVPRALGVDPGQSSSSVRRLTSRSITARATRSSRRRSSGSAGARMCTRSSCRAHSSSAHTCSSTSFLPSSARSRQSMRRASSQPPISSSRRGTMNREAVALGVPVYTVFAGRLGGVDEQLIRDGRLSVLRRAGRDRRPSTERAGRLTRCATR